MVREKHQVHLLLFYSCKMIFADSPGQSGEFIMLVIVIIRQLPVATVLIFPLHDDTLCIYTIEYLSRIWDGRGAICRNMCLHTSPR